MAIKEKEYQTVFIGDESDYHKTGKKEMEEFINKKPGDLKLVGLCEGYIRMTYWFHTTSKVYIQVLKLINIVNGWRLKQPILSKNFWMTQFVNYLLAVDRMN